MTAEPLTRWTLLALDGPAPQEVAGRAVPTTVPGTVHTDLLAAGQRVAGNSVFGLADQVSLMIGPALAGAVTALAGAALVIVLDAASWLVLAVSYARIAPWPAAWPNRPDPRRLPPLPLPPPAPGPRSGRVPCCRACSP